MIGLVQPPALVSMAFVDFDGLIPSGTPTPYLRTVNIAAGTRWAAEKGSLTLDHRAFRTSSAVYSSLLTSNSNGANELTFWWGSPIPNPSFKLVNDGNPKSFYILISDTRLHDRSLFLEVRLDAYEERVIDLPESGVSRFTVMRNGWGYFAIDDVTWEETKP